MLGISTPHGEGVAQLTFFGLFALQHRGQEAAGIAVSDGQRARVHKQPGLVSHVFTNDTLKPLTGYHAIGHTRYSTTGSSNERNIQPFLVETMHGPLALAHNGNLVNTPALRDELLTQGFGLTATSDSEVMTLMLAAAGGQDVGGAHRAHAAGVEGRVLARPARRRPRARRAATRGGSGRCPSVASPTAGTPSPVRRARCRRSAASRSARSSRARSSRCSGAELHRRQALAPRHDQARCTFEFVYFCRPDSVWNGRNVHLARERLGAELAAESPVDADVVIPVPDSSIPAAIGYSRASGVPYNDGLIKNRYIGRTFIEPTQEIRDRGVALKFNALPREPRRPAGRHDRRLARARHHRRAARQADPRRRRHRGAPAHHVPADHAPVPLRRRHGPRRRPDGRPPDASRRSASGSAPTAWSSSRWTG